MRDFEYFEPSTVSEATSLLAKYKGEAKIIAGGTDLLVEMKQERISPKYIINIKTIPGFDYIIYDSKEGLRIGALTTIRALEKSTELRQRYPVISQVVSQFGNIPVRNVATLGGNLCNAVPSADTAPALIGLSARAKIVGTDGERIIPLEDFFTGSGSTVLKTGEILVEIQVPVPPANTKGVYLKYAIRGKTDLPVVGIAVVVTLEPKDKVCKNIKIVLGNVAPTPMRANKAESVLRGKPYSAELVRQASEAASDEARPISDIRASAEYRKEMVRILTARALNKAKEEIK